MKPKIWGDVSKSAIGLAQLRAHEIANQTGGAPYLSGVAGGSTANSKNGHKEVIITPTEAPSLVTKFYITGHKARKAGGDDSVTWEGKETYLPPYFPTHGVFYGGTGINQPTVYGGVIGGKLVTLPTEYYIGRGRFGSFAESGFHHGQLYMPSANLYENVYSYTDSGVTVQCTLGVYGIYTGADPETPLYDSMWSGIVFAMSRVKPHYSAILLADASAASMWKWSTLGSFDCPYELVYRAAPLGTNATYKGGLAFATVAKGADLNGFPNTGVVYAAFADDAANTYSNGIAISSYFDTPTYKFLGPMVATAPGKAVHIAISATPAPRYFIETRRVVGGDPIFRHAWCNAYGLANIGTIIPPAEVVNLFDAAGVYYPNTPDYPPEDVINIVAAKTTNWGSTWGTTVVDTATVFPDTLPYIKHSGVYSHEYFFTRTYTSVQNDDLDALTLAQRIASDDFNYIFRNVALSYTDYYALLLERSAMCVIDEDTVLWFLQTFVAAVVDEGGGNFSINTTESTTNYHLKNVLLKSTDSGSTWARETGFPESPSTVFGVAYETSVTVADYEEHWRGETLFEPICLRPGVVLTKLVYRNRGAMGGEGPNHRPAVSPASALRPWKFYKSTNSGTSWTAVTPTGLPSYATTNHGAAGKMTVINVQNGVTTIAMYALDDSTDTVNLYISKDDGATWTIGGGAVVLDTFGGSFPYRPLNNDDNPIVGWEQMTNENANCWGYSWPVPQGSFEKVHYTGAHCEKSGDIALPWRLDATAIP